MERRKFLKTSAGFMAASIIPGVYRIHKSNSTPERIKFRDHQSKTSFGKVKIITPDDGFYIHTFNDVSPFSPSRRYVAVTRLPYQDKDAVYGDTADVCVVDLENETIEKVYSTKGWGFQLGANLNWGKTDRYLYTNDIIDNQAVCVRIDLENKGIKAYAGPMYHIAPDESAVIGFPLDIINDTQMGYGVPYFRDVEKIKGAPDDQGIWRTDLKTNEKELLVSLKDVFLKTKDPEFLEGGNLYFFHSKYNKQGTRIMQVYRCIYPGKGGRRSMLFSFDADGNNIEQTVTREQWDQGGHHPNWHPDGEHIIMNLVPKMFGEPGMRFCLIHHAGKDFKVLSTKFRGSGHPSVDPTTTYLVSDYYVSSYKRLGYDECPIRLINLDTEDEVHICKVFTDLDITNGTLRLDPHPSWSHDYKKVCFNGAPGGRRQVFVADLEGLI